MYLGKANEHIATLRLYAGDAVFYRDSNGSGDPEDDRIVCWIPNNGGDRYVYPKSMHHSIRKLELSRRERPHSPTARSTMTQEHHRAYEHIYNAIPELAALGMFLYIFFFYSY